MKIEDETFKQGTNFTCSYWENCCLLISLVTFISYIKPQLKASLLPQKAAKANTHKKRGSAPIHRKDVQKGIHLLTFLIQYPQTLEKYKGSRHEKSGTGQSLPKQHLLLPPWDSRRTPKGISYRSLWLRVGKLQHLFTLFLHTDVSNYQRSKNSNFTLLTSPRVWWMSRYIPWQFWAVFWSGWLL